MPIVFIGIGSNLGDRALNINRAIECLTDTEEIVVEKISSIIETLPIQAEGPNYLNGVVKIITSLSPGDLLKKLLSIEDKLGRVRLKKNSSRTIDLDILLYGDEAINEPELKVPHPRMFEREFVMRPLQEIDPDIVRKLKI